jgi:hypothetical protein
MGKQSEGDTHRDYFKPLKSFRYNPYFHPYTAANKQTVLAQRLNKSYGVPLGNILRLIMYTDIALSLANESDLQLYYSDLKQIADFEKEPQIFDKLIFVGKNRSVEIENPFLIERVFRSMINLIDSRNIIRNKSNTKKKTSSVILKKVATELYRELCTEEKFSPWRSLCITGYIFALYKVRLDNEEIIMTEEEFDQKNKDNKVVSETYLQYLSSKIKAYILE